MTSYCMFHQQLITWPPYCFEPLSSLASSWRCMCGDSDPNRVQQMWGCGAQRDTLLYFFLVYPFLFRYSPKYINLKKTKFYPLLTSFYGSPMAVVVKSEFFRLDMEWQYWGRTLYIEAYFISQAGMLLLPCGNYAEAREFHGSLTSSLVP